MKVLVQNGFFVELPDLGRNQLQFDGGNTHSLVDLMIVQLDAVNQLLNFLMQFLPVHSEKRYFYPSKIDRIIPRFTRNTSSNKNVC